MGDAVAVGPGAAQKPMRWRLWTLVLLVSAAHLWLADWVGVDRFGLGAGPGAAPARMQVAFVRELRPQAPPGLVVAPRQAAPRRMPRQATAAAAAASQPAAAPTAPPSAAEPPPPETVTASIEVASAPAGQPAPPEPAGAAPESATATATATATAVAAAAAQPAASSPMATPLAAAETAADNFAWPPSTRLSYTLTGHYRGPVEGQAQVEWLLDGARYQVHMDLSIGPTFAPLASRRVSSEGVVTPQGLSPRRYDEVTRALMRKPQQLTVWLDDGQVRLANGRVEARPAGVQDSASQFVHLTWLFTTQPTLLRAGQTVTLPLALPRRLEPWVYDVVGAQTLVTPAGEVETFHVKPRRLPQPGNELTAEIWVAPSLQYLPVRIVIRQDENTFLDLQISRLPQQADRPR